MATGKDCIDFLKAKSEALEKYQQYKKWAKMQWNADIKCLGSDHGGEYLSTEFSKHLKTIGTICHLTVHDSPQSNSAAECSHCTHIERARLMLIGTGLSHNLWAEAISHSVWIRNRVLSKASPEFKLPIEKATCCKPDLRGLLEWGTQIWVKNLQARKLGPQAKEGCFVGYNDESKGYHVYWPGKNRVSVERNVYIDKKAILEPGVVRFEEEWEPDE